MTEPIARLPSALADRYVIERGLGAGGMATVYLAHDRRHQRRVALRVLHAELSGILGAAHVRFPEHAPDCRAAIL